VSVGGDHPTCAHNPDRSGAGAAGVYQLNPNFSKNDSINQTAYTSKTNGFCIWWHINKWKIGECKLQSRGLFLLQSHNGLTCPTDEISWWSFCQHPPTHLWVKTVTGKYNSRK